MFGSILKALSSSRPASGHPFQTLVFSLKSTVSRLSKTSRGRQKYSGRSHVTEFLEISKLFFFICLICLPGGEETLILGRIWNYEIMKLTQKDKKNSFWKLTLVNAVFMYCNTAKTSTIISGIFHKWLKSSRVYLLVKRISSGSFFYHYLSINN